MRGSMGCLALAVALASGALAANARAQGAAGDWAGTLAIGQARLRLLVHIASGAHGLSGTLDSLDQGAMGIPISSISVRHDAVRFQAASVHGSYVGTLNSARTVLHGTWTQDTALPLDFERVTPSELDGAWAGTLRMGTATLRLVLHLAAGPQGLMASLQSPDQANAVMPASMVRLDASGLVFAVDDVQARFAGKVDSSQGSISGVFTQRGDSAPLELRRVRDPADLRPPRPQNPARPYPYREEEVSYRNPAANFRLAATLTIPPGKGPFPAALLITGSGPQDRDETIAGHKPFLVIADYLTRRGIAVLRADDRGVGHSGGRFADATTADFATDAEAGVAWLQTRPEIDARKIGLIGHSEGAIVAAMVAARNHVVASIAMLGGAGVPGDDIVVEQVRLISLANGATQLEAETLAAQQRRITNLVKSGRDRETLRPQLRELLKDKPAAEVDALISQLLSPWYRYFLAFDPASALRQATCPVLALTGGKDLQAPAALNLPAIRRALQEGGNRHFEVVEMPGLNHMFQVADTGSPAEYGQIDETIAPVVLEKLARWMAAQ